MQALQYFSIDFMQALSQSTHQCLISTIKSIVPKLGPLRHLYQLRYSSENLLGIQAQICEQVQDILQCLEKIQVEPCCIEAKVEDVRQFLSKEKDFLWAEKKASKLKQRNQQYCNLDSLMNYVLKGQLSFLYSPVHEPNKYQQYQKEEQKLGLRRCQSCEMYNQQNQDQQMEEQQEEVKEKIAKKEEQREQEQEHDEEQGSEQQEQQQQEEEAPDYSHVFDN